MINHSHNNEKSFSTSYERWGQMKTSKLNGQLEGNFPFETLFSLEICAVLPHSLSSKLESGVCSACREASIDASLGLHASVHPSNIAPKTPRRGKTVAQTE